MRKILLAFNERLYALAFVATVFYMGMNYALYKQLEAESRRTYSFQMLAAVAIFFAVIYGVLWLIAYYHHKNHIHISVKSCLCMAILTPLLVLPHWIYWLIDYPQLIQKSAEIFKWFIILTTFTYPAVLFAISLIICISYIICSVQIRKENKALGWKG